MNPGGIAAIIGAVIVIVGFILGIHADSGKKRKRIYERLDEAKQGFENKIEHNYNKYETKMEQNYARKDICALTHQQIEKRLKDIENHTALIPNVAAQLQLLVNHQNQNRKE